MFSIFNNDCMLNPYWLKCCKKTISIEVIGMPNTSNGNQFATTAELFDVSEAATLDIALLPRNFSMP
jgi:hypothetical protein